MLEATGSNPVEDVFAAVTLARMGGSPIAAYVRLIDTRRTLSIKLRFANALKSRQPKRWPILKHISFNAVVWFAGTIVALLRWMRIIAMVSRRNSLCLMRYDGASPCAV
jgi:D-aminopeptidase